MTVDSYESLYYDKGHKGLQNEIDRLERKNDELENINDKLSSALKSAENKVERLHSIIKEVREYLDIDESIRKTCKRYDVNGIAILEILEGSDK